ncbi:DUF397 domain-containing protein [Streptomyces mangrovi]|uniref:DUF397 domain-containing protein n=1 Tax=Streptomyces mangrovi TaxID=1206892 RepID=UPI00399D32D0
MSMRITDSSALGVIWTASSYSGNTNCVEAAALPDRQYIAVRDSKDPAGPALAFGTAPWAAFLEQMRAEG